MPVPVSAKHSVESKIEDRSCRAQNLRVRRGMPRLSGRGNMVRGFCGCLRANVSSCPVKASPREAAVKIASSERARRIHL